MSVKKTVYTRTIAAAAAAVAEQDEKKRKESAETSHQHVLYGKASVRAADEEELGLVDTGKLVEEIRLFRLLLCHPPVHRKTKN